MDIKLSKRDSRLIDIHGALYPFVEYGTSGMKWWLKTPDYDEEFPTYKAFIEFIEGEVKRVLLTYAINGELRELAEV